MTHVAQSIATRNMDAFIKRDPTSVNITNRHTVKTPTGGSRWVNDDSVPAETVRLIPATTTTEKQPIRTTPDGRTVLPSWMVCCLPTTKIKLGAILVADGIRYEIVFRSRVPSWRVVFEAIENG